MKSTLPKPAHCKNQIRASVSKNIDSSTKSTAKNKLVPRGQQNRLHLNEDTQKGKQKSCLEVNEIDFTKKSTLQEIN